MKRQSASVALSIGIMFLSACSLSPQLSRLVQVNVRGQDGARAANNLTQAFSLDQPVMRAFGVVTTPVAASGMDCFAVNVNGPGIASDTSNPIADEVLWDCLGFGNLSQMVSTSTATSTGISFQTLSGPARTFQMLGIATGGGASSCDGKSLGDLLASSTPGLFELGRADASDVYLDGTTVTVNNQYSSGDTELVTSCLQAVIGSFEISHAFYGGDTTLISFSDTLTSFPPFGLTESIYPANIVNSFSPNVITASPTVSSNRARVDLLYDLTHSRFSQFSRIQVEIKAAGGTTTYGGSCGATISAGSGFEAHAWIGGTSSWSQASASSTSSSSSTQYLTLDDTLDTAPSELPITEGDGTFLHLSIRSKNAVSSSSPTNCSAVQIYSVTITPTRVQ